jgi:hypothetical protein
MDIGEAVKIVKRNEAVSIIEKHLQCQKRHLALLWRHDYGRV